MARATSFDTEEMDAATTSAASNRVNEILHPEQTAPTPVPSAPAPSTATPIHRRRQRSDAGIKRGPKPEPKAGMVTLRLELSIADATELLGYFVRTQHPEIAHLLIDALAKAQRSAE